MYSYNILQIEKMPYLKWDDRYSVNDEFIDSQHKNIIKAINALIDAIDEGKTGPFCLKLYTALKAYAERHFAHEEQILLEQHYPDLKAHREQHRLYIKKIEEIHEKFNDNEADIEIELEMLDFLKEWFYKHILKSDFEYVKYFQSP